MEQDKITYTHKAIENIYIVYELRASGYFNNDPTVKNSLFGAVRLAKNADIEKYHYSGYGIGFDRSSFSFQGGGFGQNVIIFGGDMSSSIHTDNKKKDILILSWGITQGLREHSLTAENMYLINFTVTKNKFFLSLHYNGANSYLFVNGLMVLKLLNLKQKILIFYELHYALETFQKTGQ